MRLQTGNLTNNYEYILLLTLV